MITNTFSMELKSFELDVLFFQNEKETLRKKFLNKFIAIKNENIIASGNSIEEVREVLETNNLNPSKTLIEFVPEEENIIIL